MCWRGRWGLGEGSAPQGGGHGAAPQGSGHGPNAGAQGALGHRSQPQGLSLGGTVWGRGLDWVTLVGPF